MLFDDPVKQVFTDLQRFFAEVFEAVDVAEDLVGDLDAGDDATFQHFRPRDVVRDFRRVETRRWTLVSQT